MTLQAFTDGFARLSKFSLPCLEFWGLVGLTGTAIFLIAYGLDLVYFASVCFFLQLF